MYYRKALVGGASLGDHWNWGAARGAIAEGRWDVVVLQQGPSSRPQSRVELLADTRKFAEEIRRAGARPALYMVWPVVSEPENFDRVSESHALAAKDVGGLLFPAGEAWRAAAKREPRVDLYSFDGLHPTPAGSYLAALVMYEVLYERSCAGLPGRVSLRDDGPAAIDLSAEQARALQDAASEAVKQMK